MKTLALAISLACGATLALAQAPPTDTNAGKAAAKGGADPQLARDFWEKHSKGGYLSKEDVARFKGADGKPLDLQKLDTDGDGRVSEKEWTSYQQAAGALRAAPDDAEHQPTVKTK
jgi:hypothetical protein